MKTGISLVMILFTIALVHSQQLARVMVGGQIIVPVGDDPGGIVVYNNTSQRGTVTSEAGTFDIAVARNDELVIQSLQFAPITVLVDAGIVSSRRISITLRETVNVLDEIIVRPYDLTGDIVADVNRVRTIDPVPFTGGQIKAEDNAPDRYTTPENIALDDMRWRYGLNFINIFKAIFDKKDEPTARSAEQELAEMYSNEFFQQNLDIKRENINDFMDYVSENGLTKPMLEQGNELALIQFLLQKRDAFKASLTEN
ncbi:peptidase associated/transthyretin-like domain-containing protein [Leeuwenhoekiella nanhaiensis]|uniref:Uncharacterized protein n=1 Tax=Leeuwenhoekiella nanhaiensis TaxID=1655491 RepID=A0A2G1VMQ1_9FLAO|nr:hypothetical protein [Leeuwenhoekiella nanhaiensis]PHQ28033.1 hypothetical protein CJ305_17145 [Leeuwenhoekiella nanhaiensis]